MQQQSVYLETTIASYLVAKPSADNLTARRQEITKIWWKSRHQYALMISLEVVREIGMGDADYAKRRNDAMIGIHVLGLQDAVMEIADALIASAAFPENARSDAIHLGFASAYAADILLTWNLKHIANPASMKRSRNIITMLGFEMQEICTPEQLTGVRRLIMYEDEILQEVWRTKEKIAREFARDPDAYWAKLRQLGAVPNKYNRKPVVQPRKSGTRKRKLTPPLIS